MKPYLVALALGLLVGVVYGLFQVRSPAPPVIALVGLLGMLAGEQLPPLVRHLLARAEASGATPRVSWLEHQVKPHMFGSLPGRTPPASTTTSASTAVPTPGDTSHG
jgi:XapX domain-containing protein